MVARRRQRRSASARPSRSTTRPARDILRASRPGCRQVVARASVPIRSTLTDDQRRPWHAIRTDLAGRTSDAAPHPGRRRLGQDGGRGAAMASSRSRRPGRAAGADRPAGPPARSDAELACSSRWPRRDAADGVAAVGGRGAALDLLGAPAIGLDGRSVAAARRGHARARPGRRRLPRPAPRGRRRAAPLRRRASARRWRGKGPRRTSC